MSKVRAAVVKNGHMSIELIELKPLGPNDLLIQHRAIGVNFDDMRATHLSVPGHEACGVVLECGRGVTEFSPGDRVAYATVSSGSYSECNVVDKHHLVLVPDWVSDEVAAMSLRKGLASYYMTRRMFFVNKNHSVLVHSAAGGLGQFLCALASHFGAQVLGVVGVDSKKSSVHGAQVTISRQSEDFAQKALEFTQNNGVSVVYDSVGSQTLNDSLRCLSKFGLLASIGQTAEERISVALDEISQRSAFVSCPQFDQYLEDHAELILMANEVFTLIQSKVLQPRLGKTYKLSQTNDAWSAFRNRQSIGQNIINPIEK